MCRLLAILIKFADAAQDVFIVSYFSEESYIRYSARAWVKNVVTASLSVLPAVEIHPFYPKPVCELASCLTHKYFCSVPIINAEAMTRSVWVEVVKLGKTHARRSGSTIFCSINLVIFSHMEP